MCEKSSGYFLNAHPLSQPNQMLQFFHIPPPPHSPLIFQTANMFFIATWDVIETSGLVASHHANFSTGLNMLLDIVTIS